MMLSSPRSNGWTGSITRRLLSSIGDITPAEFEERYWMEKEGEGAAGLKQLSLHRTWGDSLGVCSSIRYQVSVRTSQPHLPPAGVGVRPFRAPFVRRAEERVGFHQQLLAVVLRIRPRLRGGRPDNAELHESRHRRAHRGGGG